MFADIYVSGAVNKVCAQRGTKNEKHEDFMIKMRRLTLIHEMIGDEEVFRFRPPPADECVLLLAVISDTGTNTKTFVVVLPQLITECSYLYEGKLLKGSLSKKEYKYRRSCVQVHTMMLGKARTL